MIYNLKKFLYDHSKTCFSGLHPSLETSYKRHFGENWEKNLNMTLHTVSCMSLHTCDIKELILILLSEIISLAMEENALTF